MFHVLVVAGLHVGAFAAFLFLPCTEIQAFTFVTSLAVVLCVICYVAVVEQRPPVLHAALMTLAVVLALVFYRRGELLNSVAIAAMIFLVASPSSLTDSSFQLSFLSMFCFAALAALWLEKSIEPCARGMRGWRDVSHIPQVAQLRIDLRSVASWFEAKLPTALALRTIQTKPVFCRLFSGCRNDRAYVGLANRIVAVAGARFLSDYAVRPLAHLVAVPLTGILVPLGFLALVVRLISQPAGLIFGTPLK